VVWVRWDHVPKLPPPRFRLAVLDLIKTAQAHNGLRHNDYARYKAYCTRRLDRIRHAKAVGFTFGRGKKFAKQELTATKVTDPRHLQIPLMTAERAWAEYSELKAELEAGDSTARQRHHCLQRLRRAVKQAEQLESLAAARADAQTAREAWAYAANMRGVLALELQDWAAAFEGIGLARALYEALAASPATPRRQRDVFAVRVEELVPQERFCRYNLEKAGRASGVRGAADAAAERIASQVKRGVAAPGADAEGPAAGAASAGAASGSSAVSASGAADATAAAGDAEGKVTELLWKGATLPVRNEKLARLLTAAAQSARRLLDYDAAAASGAATGAAAAASGPTTASSSSTAASKASEGARSVLSSTESVYLELVSKLEEAARVAGAEGARAAKEGKVALAVDHAATEEAIRFAKARFALERNGLLAATAVRGLEAAQALSAEGGAEGGPAAGAAGGKGKKRARAPADAAAGAGAGAGAAAAKLPAASATFGANPWLAALTDSLTSSASAEAGKGGVTSSGGGAAVNPAAVRAAFQVATWFGRSVKTLEEMIAMAAAPVGPASFAPSAAAAAGAGGPPSPSSAAAAAAAAGAGAGAELAADTDLVAALHARRAVCAAWRSYYLALSHVHARRYVDATKLMHRAQTRADEAIEALRLLPGSLKPRDLPARPLYPLVPEHAAAAPRGVVASGVSLGDRGAMNELLDAVSQQTVGLQATALLHQLAARCRRDGAFAEGFAKLAPHLAVQRGGGAASKATPGAAGSAGGAAAALPGVLPPRSASRPTYLPERTSVVGVAEAVTDAEAISPAVPLPVAVPFKPLLLDLAFNYFAYPAGVARRVPKAELKEGKPAAAGAGGAGKAAAAAASNAPEVGTGWGSGSNAPESPAEPSSGAAADAGSAGKSGSGLLGWLTGR
jgi:hypothetical protein